MTPGRALYLTRRFLRHGVRGAWHREITLPRIFSQPPITGLTDDSCEVHVLTSREDWIMLLWALRTFYRTSRTRYRLCVHEDGTLPASARQRLQEQFPDARIISRSDADDRMAAALRDAPRCAEYRRQHPLLLKTFDFPIFLESERLLLLDSDILFFRRPETLLARISDPGYRRNTLNRDWAYGYSVPPEELAGHGLSNVEPLINSGLGLLHAGSIRSEWCEEYFTRLPSLPSHSHRIEQTLIALCSMRFGHEFLPPEYDVYSGPTDFSRCSRHFSGPFRETLFSEGVPWVWRHRATTLC
jgi:hypothetical protein